MSAELQKAKEFFQTLIHQHFLSHPVGRFEICESHLAYVFLTLFSRRALEGFLREIHGDFRAENIFFAEGKFYPFDRIEFSLDYRTHDVLCDVAALSVDFLYFDQPQTRRQFSSCYRETELGNGMETILPFYELFWTMVNAYVAASLRNQHAGGPLGDAHQKKLDRYLEVAGEVNFEP